MNKVITEVSAMDYVFVTECGCVQPLLDWELSSVSLTASSLTVTELTEVSIIVKYTIMLANFLSLVTAAPFLSL